MFPLNHPQNCSTVRTHTLTHAVRWSCKSLLSGGCLSATPGVFQQEQEVTEGDQGMEEKRKYPQITATEWHQDC